MSSREGNVAGPEIFLEENQKHLRVLSQEFIEQEARDLGCCSVLLIGDMEAQRGPQREVREEGAGHLLKLGVGPQGLEVLHIVPEVRGGERPVGHGGRLRIGV